MHDEWPPDIPDGDSAFGRHTGNLSSGAYTINKQHQSHKRIRLMSLFRYSLRGALSAAVFFSASLLVVICAAQTKKVRYPLSKSEQQAYSEWKVYGGGSDNIKYSALDQINADNVKTLQVAWTYSSGEASSTNRTDMKVNPLIVDGTLYGLNPQLRLFALDGATGKVKWVYNPGQVPVKGKNIGRGDFASSTKISRGLAFYKGSDTDQRIIYAPGGGHALYCVDALTGQLITSFGDHGIVDMHDNLDEVLEHPHDLHISMTSPGIIYKDTIIVGSRLSEGAETPPGHIRAYDVHTGRVRWVFHTIPHPGEPGYNTYENKEAYTDFKGYEDWAVVSSARTDEVLKVIVANPAMIKAYKAGVPGNGQPLPDGAKIAKLQWKPKKSTEAPFVVDAPDVFTQAFVMEKNSKRFPKSGGWGYAVFNYDAATDKFTADPKSPSDCGYTCHVAVKAKDHIFHPYQKR
jgi:hypothetical protein